jgi:hypothetical protein
VVPTDEKNRFSSITGHAKAHGSICGLVPAKYIQGAGSQVRNPFPKATTLWVLIDHTPYTQDDYSISTSIQIHSLLYSGINVARSNIDANYVSKNYSNSTKHGTLRKQNIGQID